MQKGPGYTSCKEALAKWNEKHPNESLNTAKKVSLICQLPSINKMDSSLNALEACEHLALSTNAIDRIGSLPGLKNLKILSLGRNNIKKFEKLEDVANTLEQLWVSHNSIERLDGLTTLKKLRVLYMSNNNIKNIDELLKLKENPALDEILLLGNPFLEQFGGNKEEYAIEVIRRLPALKKLDGDMISAKLRDLANEEKSEMKDTQ